MGKVYTTLTAQILSKLQDVSTFDVDNIFDEPRAKITGYPAVVFYPAEGDVDYEMTSDDERQYNYNIEVYYEYDAAGISKALDALYDCVDDVLDEFSEDRMLAGITMPADTVLLGVEPVFAEWGELPNKKVLAAIINLKIRVSVTSS